MKKLLSIISILIFSVLHIHALSKMYMVGRDTHNLKYSGSMIMCSNHVRNIDRGEIIAKCDQTGNKIKIAVVRTHFNKLTGFSIYEGVDNFGNNYIFKIDRHRKFRKVPQPLIIATRSQNDK